MIKCKYAGDPNDDCCKDCDGLVIYETNAKGEMVEIPCTECGGYEPEEVTAEPVKDEPPFDADNAKSVNTVEPEKTAPESSVANEKTEVINNTTEKEKSSTVENTQEILEITAGTGISVELNGVWYKFDYSEKRAVNPNADINAQKKALWEEVFNQVDGALQDTKESLGM